MYSEKMAVAVKVNGKVLREFKDTVYIPFGSEYSILVKNLNSVRARVRISVDGTDATENVWLIVDKNDEIELERFIKGGNLNEGNRFKFIERTANIEQHRGIKVDDGLIRVEFEYERQPTKLEDTRWLKQAFINSAPTWGGSLCDTARTLNCVGSMSTNTTQIASNISCNAAFAAPAVAQALSAPVVSDVGITVPGSISDQKFTTTYGFSSDGQTHTMIVKMLGETETGNAIAKAVTVKAKPKCTTCGTINKATARFCSSCGTSLEIVGTSIHSPAFIEAYKWGWSAGKAGAAFPTSFVNSTNVDGYAQGYRDARGKKKRLYK